MTQHGSATPRVGGLPADVPVDLDACAAEPIRVPGSVQPHGVLLAVTEPGLEVRHASRTVEGLVGRPAEDVVGTGLGSVLGLEAADAVRHHVRTFGDLRARNPLSVDVAGPAGPVTMDAILHRVAVGTGTLLVVELEPAYGPRPFSFPNTYQAVRGAVEELNGARSLEALYDVAAREVRALTGFDRVMVYRFDAEYNGEVVAEARREDLNSFLGLHYPASDIPPQARQLYETNWVRLIADVGYTPSPVVPPLDPASGEPLDMTHAVLRSVSPVHIEYLGNMGVRASMSISLLRDGRLWGLVACHHYSGPYMPPYGVRAAAEFLGSTLSLRLVARAEERELETELAAQGALGRVLHAARDSDRALADALAAGSGLLDLVPAQGVVVRADGLVATTGAVPADVAPLLDWVAGRDAPVTACTSLAEQAPELAARLPGVAGVLAVQLPDDQCVVWLRHEVVQDVYWGGDPHNAKIAREEDGKVRLSPRLSFDRWREVVRGRSEAWAGAHVRAVEQLRTRLLEVLLLRNRWQMAAAYALQQSLLPRALPQPAGWSVHARYEPSAGGRVGGDWYDALELPDGRVAVVVGDVAGHGVGAAAAMGQLRNALRAYLLRGQAVEEALADLDALARRTMRDDMATLVVAVVDPATGEALVGAAGHPLPLLVDGSGRASLADVPVDRPIGVGSGAPRAASVQVEMGGALVLYSDGLVDSRSTSLAAGIERLVSAFGAGARGERVDIDDVVEACRDDDSTDDITLLVLAREQVLVTAGAGAA
ncbi:SpoIIE family protein phosphatase [Cellulomonas shaoxiangyii]|uniref:GAF domain-containing protein n=1 Tax=Cellulomonas shaoxiangyii TaxID=2566013 RepID=A0A4P7SL46_9CELL|nr:SpoIIE family protein phosphatase [Cellulomonas shaoxiangyii]QCB94940.1 GAF domain-containing protein [Cellulomonas shaoxiangyii]TGY84448.1 GAF domain-containing protein [Cellulomonas shaoxiangyii]